LTIAWVAIGAQVGFLVWQANRRDNFESQTMPLIGVFAAGGVGIGFALAGAKKQRNAVFAYNRNIKSETSNLHLGTTRNGVGLVFSF